MLSGELGSDSAYRFAFEDLGITIEKYDSG